MIDPTSKPSINPQARVLGISGSVYYQPRPISTVDLKLMHRIDKLHMQLPFAGSQDLSLSDTPFAPQTHTKCQSDQNFHSLPQNAIR